MGPSSNAFKSPRNFCEHLERRVRNTAGSLALFSQHCGGDPRPVVVVWHTHCAEHLGGLGTVPGKAAAVTLGLSSMRSSAGLLCSVWLRGRYCGLV